MGVLWTYTFRRLWGAMLGWGVSLAALGAYVVLFYDSVAERREEWERLLGAVPQELLAFFGDWAQFTTPVGFLDTQLFSYLPLLLGIYAVLVGASLISEPEEAGFLDILLSCPVNRPTFLVVRWLAFAAATAIILGVAWAGLAAARPFSARLDIDAARLILPMVSLFGQLLLFGTLALFLSQILPSRNSAAMVAGLFLGASFFVEGLARVSPNLETAARFSPLNYYQSAYAVWGLKIDWLAGLGLVTAVLLAGAIGLFRRRDIRAGGTGSLRLVGPVRR